MSDRTPGSVRSASPAGDGAASDESAAGAPPASATQSIPGAATQRTQDDAGLGVTSGRAPADDGGAGTTTAAKGETARVAGKAGAGRSGAGKAGAGKAGAGTTGAGTTGAGTTGAGTTGAGTAGTTGAGTTGEGRTSAVKAAGRAVRGSGKAAGRGPRRARLQLRHIDTWSALKISLVLSIALFFIWMVAVGILYGVLNQLGVFETLNDLFGQVGSVSGNEATGDVITPGVVFGGAAVIGAINIVLMTALCTVGTFIYNMCSDLVGGLEVTLSERD